MDIFHVEIVGRHRIGDGVLSEDLRLLHCISKGHVSSFLVKEALLTVSSTLDQAQWDYTQASPW